MSRAEIAGAVWEIEPGEPEYVLLVWTRGERQVLAGGANKQAALLRAADLHEGGDHFVAAVYGRSEQAIVAQQLTETELPGYVAGYRQAARGGAARPWRKQA